MKLPVSDEQTLDKSLAIVVNDDPTQLQYLVSLVRREGLVVSSFEKAEDALLSMNQSRPPGLIVTDLYMPGIDGWRFCRLLKSPEYKAFNTIPILVVSATFSGAEASTITADLGANAFLSSPVNGKNFSKTVKSLLADKTPSDRLNVLIVEDGKSTARLLEIAFTKRGYFAKTAATVEEALAAFDKTSYNLAILDYHLPDGRGDELLSQFISTRPECVCIMMTTDPNPELALSWMKQGAAAYLHKPFEPKYLIELCNKSRRERTLLRVEDLLEERTSQLRQSETRFRDLAEMLPEVVFETDTSLNMTYTNQRGYELFGYTKEEVPEKLSCYDLLTHNERDRAKKNLSSRLINNSLGSVEYMAQKKDGSTFPALLHLAPVMDGKTVKGFRGVLVDITDRKQAEIEKNQLEDSLRVSQKMEAMGRLAGGVAHDFNNVLCAILGNASMAMDDISKKDPLYESIEEITEAANRAADLTRQLLAFSRKQIIEPKIIDLSHLIDRLYTMLFRVIGEDILLEIDSPKHLGHINADTGQIEQIILNLAINARDAMPNGGKLTIKTLDIHPDDDFYEKHPGITAGAHVMLAVNDDGIGMDSDTCSKIFEPFFSTKEQGKGTGLGLSTVYGIVKQHGGIVTVDSKPGTGTSFSIYFPKVLGEAEPTSPSQVPKLLEGTETVLVVEDESMVRNAAIKILTRFGYNILEADSGKKALEVAKNYDGPIDLLLTDVVMPHMNGHELAKKLIEKRPTTKVLFTSGYTQDIIARHGVLEKGVRLLSKPYSPTVLAESLRDALDEPEMAKR